jgi:hypothetical protein
MKNLPIGIQSFEDFRSNDYLYVDKTEIIRQVITTGKVYFLSRPRRFGKSLLISTIDALFSGRKNLFEGLYIYDKWDWSEQYPVIRLDFGGLTFKTPKMLANSLSYFVNKVASEHSIILRSTETPTQFAELIEQLHISTGQKVVVLVDEYDKPITDHLSNPEVMNENKNTLHDFYQVLKASDDHIRFIFLTGVSKFAGVSVFSALNNPDDITLDDAYASICGYTQQELESCFAEYIDDVAAHLGSSREELLAFIKKWYNGYSWNGKVWVYNPFSTLSLFRKKKFANYWFRTGTPTFLIELLKKRNQLSTVLKPVQAGVTSFDSYDPANIDEVAILFQTGYLTIKHVDASLEYSQYTLEVPNEEVRESFLMCLLNGYSDYSIGQLPPLIYQLRRQVRAGDTSGMEQNLRMLLAHIPNTLHIGKEAYYHSLFLLLMKLLGFDIWGELLTNIGRIDAVWRQPGLTVVAEVKYHAEKDIESLLDDAMKQIRDRRYYEAFLTDGKVTLMGIAFSGKEVRCRLESVS